MQLLHAPLLLPTAHNVREIQAERPVGVRERVQARDAVGEEHGAVVEGAGERVRAHERPVDVRGDAGEELGAVGVVQQVEERGDVRFVGVARFPC